MTVSTKNDLVPGRPYPCPECRMLLPFDGWDRPGSRLGLVGHVIHTHPLSRVAQDCRIVRATMSFLASVIPLLTCYCMVTARRTAAAGAALALQLFA